VHFNALDGETTNQSLFKSTWYCLTIMMPTRDNRSLQKDRRTLKSGAKSDVQESGGLKTLCFTDMTRQPRATLRVVLVNESELRRVADGKLRPPTHGFFNERHAERFRMMTDLARNFQKQLIRTPSDARAISERSPFTSEKVHSKDSHTLDSKPDGGHMKRVHSVPNMSVAALSGSLGRSSSKLGGSPDKSSSRRMPSGLSGLGKDHGQAVSTEDAMDIHERWEQTEAESGLVSENNCFLRLHVPHYIGHKEASGQRQGGSLQRSLDSSASIANQDAVHSPIVTAVKESSTRDSKTFGPREGSSSDVRRTHHRMSST